MPPFDSEIALGSNEPAKNGYGQNGYQGASSDLPGKKTSSNFLPQTTVPAADWQTRKVSNAPLAAAHGMKGPKTGEKIPDNNIRRPRVQTASGSFQR